MTDWLGIGLLYLVGCSLLVIEIFLPAHGLLGLIGVGVLGFAVHRTYGMNELMGLVSLAVLAVLLPTGAIVAVKNWHRTPIGRRISPPNPQLTAADRMPVEDLKPLIGQTGLAVTLLRPVGTCEFAGRRVECKAEHGLIERNTAVKAIRLIDRTVCVRPVGPVESTEKV